MTNLTRSAAIGSLIALGLALAPRMNADTWDQLTTVTFSAPVEIPGRFCWREHMFSSCSIPRRIVALSKSSTRTRPYVCPRRPFLLRRTHRSANTSEHQLHAGSGVRQVDAVVGPRNGFDRASRN